MRLNNLFGGTFLGIILILVGIAALLRSFDINLPFGRIVIGLLIIYVGFAFLFGGGIFIEDGNTIVFNSSNIKVTDNIEGEYNIIFGSGIIDLTDVDPDNITTNIEINTIFGTSEVLLDSNKPMRIELSSVFGRATAPDGNAVTFGDYVISNKTNDNDYIINIKAAAVFGGTNIRFVK